MAIEVEVYKEIRTYKEKYIGGLTVRQLISGGIAVVVAGAVGVCNHFFWKIPIDALGPFLVLGAMPIFAVGWFEKNGLPFEKWLIMILSYHFNQQIRPYQTETLEVIIRDKQDKKRQTKINERLNDDGTKKGRQRSSKAKKETRKTAT
ncbi:PrgI family protein [Vagococcus salmoninarum]|uniref:PrgI family protein n=1 Tax=Vagococcus salmoninarum TaxID=2739 RepID=UPI0028D573B1|nr:PrgI family protein [Vagococcus salmoninarum]